MTHPNSSNNYDKEVHQESYTDGNGNIYQTKQTTETINSNSNPDAYRHGYIHGQAAERSQRRRIVQRDEDNTSRGLLLGSLLATIAILAGGFLWYINQRDNDVTPVTPIIVPNANKPQESPSPSPSPTPQSQTQQESKKKPLSSKKLEKFPFLFQFLNQKRHNLQVLKLNLPLNPQPHNNNLRGRKPKLILIL